MKFLLFLAALVAFYLGVNYMSLTEGSVERWIKTSQYPSVEGAEAFCATLNPNTKVEFTNTINKHKKVNTVATDAKSMCDYMKSLIIQGINNKNTQRSIKIENINRVNELPFNQGVVSARTTLRNYVVKQQRNRRTGKVAISREEIQIIRNQEITFKRTMLGDYIILSIKGHDHITRPEKNRQRF